MSRLPCAQWVRVASGRSAPAEGHGSAPAGPGPGCREDRRWTRKRDCLPDEQRGGLEWAPGDRLVRVIPGMEGPIAWSSQLVADPVLAHGRLAPP